MSIWPEAPGPVAPIFITTIGRYGLGKPAAATAAAAPNATTTGVNRATLHPIQIPERVIAYKLFWASGVISAGATVDLGIYTDDFQRIVSTGSQAVPGSADVVQEFDIADTVLDRGRYYLAFAGGATSPSFWRLTLTNGPTHALMGGTINAAGFPLPATFTPQLTSSGSLHIFGLACRLLAA